MAATASRADWWSAGLGLAFVVAGLTVVLAVEGPVRWQVGGAGLFLGAFLIVVLGPWSGRPREAAALEVLYRSWAGLASELKLDGGGIFVAARTVPTLAEDRVVVPASTMALDELPALDIGTRLSLGRAPSIVLDPPGGPLLDTHERRLGTRLADVPFGELPVVMGSFVAGDRMVRAVAYRKSGPQVTIRFRHVQGGELCERMRREMPVLVRQVGCPVCSAMVLALSRSLHQPVRLDAVREERGETILEVTTPS